MTETNGLVYKISDDLNITAKLLREIIVGVYHDTANFYYEGIAYSEYESNSDEQLVDNVVRAVFMGHDLVIVGKDGEKYYLGLDYLLAGLALFIYDCPDLANGKFISPSIVGSDNMIDYILQYCFFGVILW